MRRFSRNKYDKSFPKQSINWLLKNSNIKLPEVNQISYSWHKGFDKKLKTLYLNREKELKHDKLSLKIFKERKNVEFVRDKKSLLKLANWSKKI